MRPVRALAARGALLAALACTVVGIARAQAASPEPTQGSPERIAEGATDESPEAVASRQVCERGDMAACSRLAGLCVSGLGVAKDEARAAALYRRACDGGNVLGCASLEWLVDRLVASGRSALERAVASDDRPACEEALQAFEAVLAVEASHEEAGNGRAEARRHLDELQRRHAATAFVQGDTVFSASAVAPPIEGVRLVIEATPPVVRPGDEYVLRYSILNPAAVSLGIGAVSVRNALAGGGVTGGGVEPRSGAASPGGLTLLVETEGVWRYDSTTEWATTLTVVLDDGSVYASTLRSRRN